MKIGEPTSRPTRPDRMCASFPADRALARRRAPKLVDPCPSDTGPPSPQGLTRLPVPMIVGPLFTIRAWSRRTVQQAFQSGARPGAAPASIFAADSLLGITHYGSKRRYESHANGQEPTPRLAGWLTAVSDERGSGFPGPLLS